jgi:hypothetical protein
MNKRILFLNLLALFSSSVCAEISNFGPYVGTLSVGPAWNSSGENQTFFLNPGIEKTYVPNHSSPRSLNAALFLGVQRPWSKKLQIQAGLDLANSTQKLSGHIWDDANPLFDNYRYHYKVSHMHLALKGKLIVSNKALLIKTQKIPLMPWISGSIGAAWNKAENFNNIPITPGTVQTPNFGSQTKTGLSYSLGIGVQYPFSPNWNAGLGYEYSGLGKSELKRASGQTLGTGLSLKSSHSQALLLNITYVSTKPKV